MTNEDLRKIVIGGAFRVHNALGAGFLEKVYGNAMKIELERAGLSVQPQAKIGVFYDEQVVGEFYADLLVNDCLIVELKAVQALAPEHEIQLVNYLTATGLEFGLLINFGLSVDVRRKHRDYRKSNPVNPAHPVNPV